MADIDLERIFIRRREQMHMIDVAIQSWQHHIAIFTQQDKSINEQYRCIISLSGNGGLGKSTLLSQCREELSSSEPLLRIAKIIDWSYIRDDASRLRFFMVNDVYEMPYFEMIHAQLSESINQRLNDFKEYKRSMALAKDIEERVSRISRGVQKIVECNALWKIPKVRMLKLLQWFARSGFYELDAGEANRKLREYVGEGTNIEIACISYLYEELSQKLGESFNDYLHAGHIIGTALGRDLQRFAKERPLLILFDTYECIEKGTYLLRSVIEAAGTQVGWIIVGRSQEWTNINSSPYLNEKNFKHDKVSLTPIVSIVLQVEGSGSFSPEEITKYFAQLRKQKPSLRAIKKSDAQKIRTITQGIPLAVSLIAQIYIQTGRLDTLLEMGKGVHDIVEGMVERYLFYVPYDRERVMLYGVAMLRRTNDLQIVDQLVGESIGQNKSHEEQLHILLHATHTIFVERDRISLHQEIRYFLRTWLLEHWEDVRRQEIAAQLQRILQMRIDTIKRRYPYQRLSGRFEDDVWVNAYLDLIEAQFWIDINQGFSYCLPFMLASIIYRRGLLNEVVVAGNFFRENMTPFHSQQWDLVVKGLQNGKLVALSEAEQSLEKIEQVLANRGQELPAPFAEWRHELEGAICWKRAELYQKHDHHKAMYWYQEAIRRIEQSDLLREEAAYEFLTVALEYYDNKEYAKSLDALREALKVKVDFAEAHYTRGDIYREIGEYNRAITEYQYTIAFDEQHISAHINLGNLYLLLKRYQDAVKQYSQTLVLEPASITLYNNRAYAYTSVGLYHEALEDYCQTIALKPDFAGAYTNRGTVYAHLYKYEEALADYNKADELSPHNIQIAWMALWANLTNQKTLERSRIEVIMSLDPEHYLSHVCRSISLALQNDNLAAILEEMDQAIQIQPEEYDHYFWKGMIYAYHQDTDMAQAAFEKALALDLPPLLLKPLYWLKTATPQFFEAYAAPLVEKAGL
jgi:tetratricopeptide (TPR) repeat protein